MDDEMIRIETKLAFLEDAVITLQKAEEDNRKDIIILKNENRILKQKIKELLENEEGDIPSRKPPHY
ncbi:MAG: SlyX family protein [Spirochaetia bacterium]|nr:SlyX family protein [Spirochaetia bacterium]